MIGIIGVVTYFNYSNQEIRLTNQMDAQKETNEAFFDKMWKIIQQKAGVSNEYRDAFASIYPDLIKGRYSNGGGQLMSWIVEQNPDFDTSLYRDLSRSIEVERTGFFNEQKKLVDLKREHDNLLQVFPSSLFLKNRNSQDITIIKSEKTEQVFDIGKEELGNLFSRKQ